MVASLLTHANDCIVSVTDEIFDKILDYLKQRPNVDSPFVFVDEIGRPFNKRMSGIASYQWSAWRKAEHLPPKKYTSTIVRIDTQTELYQVLEKGEGHLMPRINKFMGHSAQVGNRTYETSMAPNRQAGTATFVKIKALQKRKQQGIAHIECLVEPTNYCQFQHHRLAFFKTSFTPQVDLLNYG